MLGVATLALPVGILEIANNGVNTPWYLLFATFWALLWRPRSWGGMAVAAIVCLAATASTVMAALYAPLALARVIALPRVREHAATAGWLAGCALQVPAVLGSRSQLSHVATLHQAVGFYAHDVILPAAGWHLAWHLRTLGNGWGVAIPAAVIAAGAAWAIVTGGTRVRFFVLTTLGLGFVLAVSGALTRWWVTTIPVSPLWEPGSRYTAVPILLLDAAAVVAVDAYVRRRGMPVRTVTVIVALGAVLAFGWVSDFRYLTVRSKGRPWPQIVANASHSCERHKLTTVELRALHAKVSCSLLRG
jgi:hypothetical protein